MVSYLHFYSLVLWVQQPWNPFVVLNILLELNQDIIRSGQFTWKQINPPMSKDSTFGFLVTFVYFKGDSPSLVVVVSGDGKCVAATLPIQGTNSRGLPLMVGKLCFFNFTGSNAHVEPCSIGFNPDNWPATFTNAHVNKLMKALQIPHFFLPLNLLEIQFVFNSQCWWMC